MKNKSSFVGSFLLLIAAMIWGSAFVAQEIAGKYVGAFTINGIRFILGGVVLLPVIFSTITFKKKKGVYVPMTKGEKKHLLVGGVLCGIALSIASTLQQLGLGAFWGIEPSSAGKAGFITALYILFVPILSLIFKKRIPFAFWGCISVALVGFYFLCLHGTNFSLASGDALVLACSVCFSVHIMLVDKFAMRADGVMLSCVQFFVAGLICSIFMFIFDRPDFSMLAHAFPSIAYIGVFSCGIAFTFQTLAQQRTSPTLATLLMSLESVFALVTAMIFDFSNNVPTLSEGIGSILIFGAVVVAQLLPQSKGVNE